MFSATARKLPVVALLALAFLAGCKNKEQAALEQAKAQAASTNMPQQIQYIDRNGDTVTTVVQPPVAAQAQQVATTITPPAPGPAPKSTDPVITALGADGQPVAATAGPNAMSGPSIQSAAPGQAPSAMVAQPAPAAPLALTVPSGTELAIRINEHISVKHSHAGDRFSGEVVEPVVQNGTIVIPKGTPVGGRIDESHRRGHFKGRSILELRLTSLTLNGSQYALDTHDNVRTKKGKGKRSSAFIAGMTGAGMLIGGVATGGVGLAIGGAAGAGAGTALAGGTGNRDIEIPAESIVHFKLADDLVVQ
jgi:hypothetical protein